jgi:hypothetical protein
MGEIGMWKSAIALCATAFFLTACGDNKPKGQSLPATRFIVGVTTPKDQTKKETVFNAIMEIVFRAPRGSEIVVFDAAANKSIFTIKVDDKDSMNLERVRLDLWKSEIGKLRDQLKQETASKTAHLLNIPRALKFIFDLPQTKLETRVLLIGTPIYIEDGAPQWSMDEGLVPAVGHLCVGKNDSPFSVSVLGKSLYGYRFYIFDIAEISYKGREHEQAVRDFWRAMIEQAEAIWVTHTEDKDSFLKQVWDVSSVVRPAAKIDCAIEKPEWVVYPRPDITPVWFLPTYVEVKAVLQTDAPTGKVKVAIIWECQKCDFDLHARPKSGDEFLYFGRAKTPEGIFYKDRETNPNIPYGYEYIEFTEPVDLRQLEVYVNFFKYDGTTASPMETRGKSRLWFEPISKSGKGPVQVVEKEFVIRARTGNRGENPKVEPYWSRISFLDTMSSAPKP